MALYDALSLVSGKATVAEAISNAFPDVNSTVVKSTGVELGVEEKGLLRDYLNLNNPLAAYSRDIQVKSTGAGTITIKWDGKANPFIEKDFFGDSEYKGVHQLDAVLKWNKPVVKQEAMDAYDLSKGAINTLGLRLEKSGKRFNQLSIIRGFEAIKTGAAPSTLTITKTKFDAATIQEQGAMYKKAIVEKATEFIKKTQYTRDLVTITLSPEVMDILSDARLLGNSVDTQFASGQYTVATIGGYKVQSGEIFLPSGVDMVIGTSDSFVHNVDIVAANAGKLGLSNDLGTYFELADINVMSPKKGIDPSDDTQTPSVKLLETYAFSVA